MSLSGYNPIVSQEHLYFGKCKEKTTSGDMFYFSIFQYFSDIHVLIFTFKKDS